MGVLDIAGFEKFMFNTFAQIPAKTTPAILKPPYFVLEQKEYMREGITWVSVEFGMHLAACIDLFEKPIGIVLILEEETIYPKANVQTY